VANGNLNCLKYAHENGCPWNEEMERSRQEATKEVCDRLHEARIQDMKEANASFQQRAREMQDSARTAERNACLEELRQVDAAHHNQVREMDGKLMERSELNYEKLREMDAKLKDTSDVHFEKRIYELKDNTKKRVADIKESLHHEWKPVLQSDRANRCEVVHSFPSNLNVTIDSPDSRTSELTAIKKKVSFLNEQKSSTIENITRITSLLESSAPLSDLQRSELEDELADNEHDFEVIKSHIQRLKEAQRKAYDV
jgi:hypothetical protein